MQMLYNSDSYVVVQFDVPGASEGHEDAAPGGAVSRSWTSWRARRSSSKVPWPKVSSAACRNWCARVRTRKSIDDYIAGFTALAQQPVVLH